MLMISAKLCFFFTLIVFTVKISPFTAKGTKTAMPLWNPIPYPPYACLIISMLNMLPCAIVMSSIFAGDERQVNNFLFWYAEANVRVPENCRFSPRVKIPARQEVR